MTPSILLLWSALSGGLLAVEGVSGEEAVVSAGVEVALVPLNSATLSQLANIPGVGEENAKAILALRAERGRLGSVEELRILPFLSETGLDNLRSATSVDLAVRGVAKGEYKTVEDVMGFFAHEPTVQEVQAMTMAYTHTNREQVERWLNASRAAAALPQLQARYEYYNRYGEDFDVLGGVSALTQQDSQLQDKVVVEVRWQLNDLVMSTEQIRVISEAQDIVKLRDKVLGEVTRLYFDRRRLQIDGLLNPPNDLRAQIDDELRLMEFTAQLDALTGGAFSAAVAAGLTPQPL